MDSAFEKAIWKCMSYQPTDEREDRKNLILPGKEMHNGTGKYRVN